MTIDPALTLLLRSFFGKPAPKKVVGGEKREGEVENGAKTKKDTATSG